MNILKFSGLKSHCPKCSCVEVSIHYCQKSFPERHTFFGVCCPEIGPPGVSEHFHRGCKACGYDWIESVPPQTESQAGE